MIVATYALSPIDLIPDFIPVLGCLDDLVLVPLGLILVVRRIPAVLMAEFMTAADGLAARPVSRVAAVLCGGAWIAGAAARRHFRPTNRRGSPRAGAILAEAPARPARPAAR